MAKPVIQIESIAKRYRIGLRAQVYPTFREAISGMARASVRRLARLGEAERDGEDTFWALNDVSFEVQRGEVVGIIGRNGAGKSTLLKILSRITEPTRGRAVIRGRVGSLLEVGTGFHPELSGRENIYLNGAILGMRRAEINRNFDAIVDFAEVEKFLDTPVKYYSSGMYVRLAFAVAAHLEPEILIVDEVLAVGDADFQKKCLGKMSDVAGSGRTVLFVSHNMTAVSGLCTSAVWLHKGGVKEVGPASRIVSTYLQSGAPLMNNQTWQDITKAPGNDDVHLRAVSVSAAGDHPGGSITVATPVRMDFEYDNHVDGAQLNLSMVLYNMEGVCIFNTFSEPRSLPAGRVRGSVHIPGHLLNDGTYRVRLMIVRDGTALLLDLEEAAIFEVFDVKREVAWHGKWVGAVRPRFEWDVRSVSTCDPPAAHALV